MSETEAEQKDRVTSGAKKNPFMAEVCRGSTTGGGSGGVWTTKDGGGRRYKLKKGPRCAIIDQGEKGETICTVDTPKKCKWDTTIWEKKETLTTGDFVGGLPKRGGSGKRKRGEQ